MTLPASRFLLSVCLVVVATCCLYIAVSQPAANDSRLRLQTTTSDNNNNNRGSKDIPAFSSIINPMALTYQEHMPVRNYYYTEEKPPLSSASVATVGAASIPPVHVLVSVEALCIDSKHFFHDELMTTFNALPHNVVNWKVVPFGNAKLPTNNQSHTPTCQHGFGECDTNTYQQCAIHLYPDPIQHIPYLACLFASLPMGHRDDPFDQWTGLEPCAKDNHLDFDKLKQCHDDPLLTWKLNKRASMETPSDHKHVPWVEINGVHMEDIDEQTTPLLQQVCKIYQQNGGHTAGCSKFLEEKSSVATLEQVSPFSSASVATAGAASVPPVHVLVSVEALCPFCKHFFHDQVMPTFNALPHDVVNWKVVPFGNAKLPTNGSHTPMCQHGFGECDTQTYQQCAIHLYPDPIQHVPYLACLFASLPMGHRDDPFDQWTGLEPCAKDNHLDFDKLKQCHDDPLLAWKLNKQASKETPSDHKHVPWVEINGVHMEDIDEQTIPLLQQVCKIYQQNGGHTAACSKSLESVQN